MTLQQERDSDTQPSPTPRGRTGPAAAFWLVWRQHGGLLVASAVVVLVLCVALALMQSTLALVHCSNVAAVPRVPLPPTSCAMVGSDHTELYSWSQWLLRAVVFLPVLVGALWGAPLVSREYERGTHGLAWGQSLAAGRWLGRKVAVLAFFLVVLALPLWWCARSVALSLSRVGVVDRFGWESFATISPLVVPYALAALTIGVAASALLRKTLPALVFAVAVCAFLGVGTADYLRPHYEPTVAVHYPGSWNDIVLGPNVLYVVDNVWADAKGRPTRTSLCLPEDVTCLAQQEVWGRITIYQPADREAEFQWIEAGLCLALAGGCLLLAVRLVRRR